MGNSSSTPDQDLHHKHQKHRNSLHITEKLNPIVDEFLKVNFFLDNFLFKVIKSCFCLSGSIHIMIIV
jgi:hypothetical protein